MSLAAVYHKIIQQVERDKKLFAVLVDPDGDKLGHLAQIVDLANTSKVDLIFVGGSLLLDDRLEQTVKHLKKHTNIPIVLFPGNNYQVHPDADALLLLSLISGRNPDFLIGQQVQAAPYLHKSGIELIPTGYMLIDGGKSSSVAYISNTQAIPSDKYDIAICTALAGQQLGLKIIYMDAGSGARYSVNSEMVSRVKKFLQIPLIVGGGIDSPQTAHNLVMSGADVIVVGNALEKDPTLIRGIADAVHNTKYFQR